MELELKRWGNSAALRLPSALVKQIGAVVGEALEVEVRDGELIIRQRRRASRLAATNPYTVASLMAGGDPNAPVPGEITEFLNMKPVGMEVIE